MSERLIDEQFEREAGHGEAARFAARRRAPWRLAVQTIGFLVGVGLLGWAASIALGPDNREQLAQLRDARAWQIASILGLSAGTIVLNGLIFWAVLLPERRLRASDVVATNALATFLSLLPFKVSMLARLAIHNRRDGLPLLVITGWMAAFAALLGVSLVPLVAASLWRRGIDPLWFLSGFGGVALLLALTVAGARIFAGRRGLERLHALLGPVSVGPLKRLFRSAAFANLHALFGMLAHARASAGATLLRLLDFGVQAARFVIAAQILGLGLGWESAVLITCTYYLIGALSPFGNLGAREGGTIALASLLGLTATEDGQDPIAIMVLLVTAAEVVVGLFGAALAAIWLRFDRLLLGTAR